MSFDVAEGEFLSVLGPSGCGKSTLLMMVAGLLNPSEGEIIINGDPVRGPRREIGVVFQSPLLLPWRNVLDNVLLPIEMLRLPRPGSIRSGRGRSSTWRRSTISPTDCRRSYRAACGSAMRAMPLRTRSSARAMSSSSSMKTATGSAPG